jgi:predicted enzyme related to lactoylglutathione lyase
MVTRDTAWLPGTPCWVDLSVADVQKATAFYGSLFGWDVDINPDPQFGGHGNFKLDGRDVAGVGTIMDPNQPQVWTTYLASDDVDATANKITDAGGSVLPPGKLQIGEFGTMIVASDPGGAVFGVWQSGTTVGAQIANVVGSVCWNENLSRDFEGNKKFYTEVFGYTYGDMSADGFNYATTDLNGAPVGGIGEMPPGATEDTPAHWMSYFAVSDTDATVKKVEELGGSVLTPAFDTSQGRIAILADNQGAPFAVIAIPGE